MHGYDWDLKDFASSLPAKRSTEFPPQTAKDSIAKIKCDSGLTRIMTDKEMELDRKICLFNVPKPSTNNLDCDGDSLRVLMCRKPFNLFEKVNKPKSLKVANVLFISFW